MLNVEVVLEKVSLTKQISIMLTDVHINCVYSIVALNKRQGLYIIPTSTK
jgi:hypothetical protein